MKISNAIYYTPYEELEKRGVSFADYGQGKSYYNQLAPLFDAMNSREAYTGKEVKFLVHAARLAGVNAQSFLDIACGAGRHAKILAEMGYTVWAIDTSERLLTVAKQSTHTEVHYANADMRTFDLEERFDCLYSLWDSYVYLSRSSDIQAFSQRCYSHLKPGGVLVLDAKNYWKPGLHNKLKRQVSRAGDLRIETIIRKQTHTQDKVYEALFTTVIHNLKNGHANVIVDQVLARMYSLADLESIFQGFELTGCYGDFDTSAKFQQESSDRLIVVLRKT